jgi:hypothetical protein
MSSNANLRAQTGLFTYLRDGEVVAIDEYLSMIKHRSRCATSTCGMSCRDIRRLETAAQQRPVGQDRTPVLVSKRSILATAPPRQLHRGAGEYRNRLSVPTILHGPSVRGHSDPDRAAIRFRGTPFAVPAAVRAPRPIIFASVFLVGACAPVILPPARPTGFLAPPKTTYSGVLSRDRSGTSETARAAPRSTAHSIDIQYLADANAVVRIAPGCTLQTSTMAPAYLNVPGRGFERRAEGVLAIKPGATCTLDDTGGFLVTAGTVVVKGAGLLELSIAGSDAAGAVEALHFTGALTDEHEVAPSVAPGTTDVHLLAEIVTSCRVCSVNHTSIGLKGGFRFEPQLERQDATSTGKTWTPVCAAPCSAQVDSHARFRIGGTGIAASEPFSIPQDRPRLVLKASGSGTAARVFGGMFVGAGALYVAIGATSLVLGETASTSTPQERSRAHGEELFGTLFGLSSLAFLIPGMLVLHYDGTTVTTDAGETLTAHDRSPTRFSLGPGGIVF